MAVFILRGKHGGSYVPPPAIIGMVFGDVPVTAFGADFIEAPCRRDHLGCATNYCGGDPCNSDGVV